MDLLESVRFICFVLLFAVCSCGAPAENFTNAIHTYLQQRSEVEKRDGGIAVGILDEHGSSIVTYGKLDNATDRAVSGDTVFRIHSMTTTFTGLLLEDMVERGSMKLDDPVAKYLPKSVQMPTYEGKRITLHHLVEETAGLGGLSSSNLEPSPADNPHSDYTVEKMYALLSGTKLTCAPGTRYVHGGVAMGLLGHVIALKAGTNFESLVEDRICRPLKMDSTRFTLTPELKSRLATGYNRAGYAIPIRDFGVLRPLGGLYSTANDLLKYVSANLGLTPSSLTPLMKKNAVRFPYATQEKGLIHFSGGGSSGCSAYAGFDQTLRRGVVVLSTSDSAYNALAIGRFLLKCKWQSDRRPEETNINRRVYSSYVGQYGAVDTQAQSGIGIRCEGDRLFLQTTGSDSSPVSELVPPGTAELLPESETCFFGRLSGRPVEFSRDCRGLVTGLTMRYLSHTFSYQKISDQPPIVPKPVKPLVAIKLDTKLLDAYVGHYEYETNAVLPTGMKTIIWREGDQMITQAWGENVLDGPFEIYPASETVFFDKITGAQTIFNTNDGGAITVVVRSPVGYPDCVGKKVLEPAQ
jgi:CubicO group peptidase (beta-lactamase class C family)